MNSSTTFETYSVRPEELNQYFDSFRNTFSVRNEGRQRGV
jgi:hypothetical protein